MYRSIELKDLLTYSSIYGLGLTDADVTHLKAMLAIYDGKVEASYIYKSTSRSYDLTLDFHKHTNSVERVVVQKVNPLATQHGYPLFCVNRDFYFKVPPKIDDMGMIEQLTGSVERGNGEVFASIDEFKKSIITKQLGTLRYRFRLDQSYIEACFWAADKTKELNSRLIDIAANRKDYADMPTYVKHIVAVLQLPDDKRVAFYVNKEEYSSWGSNNFNLGIDFYTTIPGDECYNFTDPDKYFSHPDQTTGKPKVIYPDADCTFPKSKDIIDNYRRGKGFLTVDKTTLDMLTKRWMRKQQDLANEQEAIKALEKKIKSKIEDLDKNGTFSYNDMDFTKDTITYEGQSITDSNVTISGILKSFSGQYSEEHLNFDNVFEQWANLVYDQLLTKGKSKGKIGDVEYELEMVTNKSKRKTGNTVEMRTFYVNGHRIVKDEVVDVIKRAICFPNTEEFSAFCESVAACSLKYHRLLASGIVISAQDEVFDETMTFKIQLDRVKNKNFIVVGDKRWKVSDTNKLITLSTAKDMTRVISVLLSDTVGMTGDEVKNLLETGKQALIEQKQKEEELLKGTMEMFGIDKVENMTCNNGKTLSGYLVHGRMRDYIVEEAKCMVFEYPTGRYLCMVDKGQNEHTNTARLVNRFYALSNDSKLAQEISTL